MSAHARLLSRHRPLARLCSFPNGPSPSPSLSRTRTQRRRAHDVSNAFITRAPPASQPTPAHAGKPPSFTLAVKDNIATADLPTTCGSRLLAGYTAPFDASVVAQLRALGGAVVGKTNLDEFGMGSHSAHSAYGPVRGEAGRSAGGSSGGSALAVARGDADVALGTDTGGSVRLPAAYAAVVGFKPSYGMLSRFGVVPYANSLDTVGLLAAGVGVIDELVNRSLLYAVHDPKDPTSLPEKVRERCTQARECYAVKGEDSRVKPAARVSLRGMTFGLPLEYNIEELNPKIRDAWLDAARRLQDLGATVVTVSLPSTRHALSAYYVLAPAEASSNLAKYDGVRYGTREPESDGAGEVLYSETRGKGFGEEVKRRILLGSYTLSSKAIDNYFIKAQKVRRLVKRDFNRVFALADPLQDPETFDLSDMDDETQLADKLGPHQVDFLLCPTAPTFPPLIEDVLRQTPLDSYMNDVFTVPASLAGLPAISIPMAIREEGSRQHAGLQLIGQYWDDARVLAVADALAPQVGGE